MGSKHNFAAIKKVSGPSGNSSSTIFRVPSVFLDFSYALAIFPHFDKRENCSSIAYLIQSPMQQYTNNF